ncbi:MAG TPA: type IV pilin [Thermoplasmata archaeon]|nr:type IV pilin [Thermoplasmata archaeon]
MKVVLREEESGVSEVVGTILILAMTVVLFSTIIIWVSSIPTPVAQTRVDILATLNPTYTLQGGSQVEQGDWINMTHQGGEPMSAGSTLIYVQDQRGSSPTTTSVIRIAAYRIVNGSVSYGMLDGTGQSWNVGQRFSYFSKFLRSTDTVTVTVVDTTRSVVLWTSVLTPPAGSRPPIFLNVYAARNNLGTPLPVQTGSPFYVFAQVIDPDGPQDLNRNSVNASLTYFYGSPSCAQPLQMYDDGPSANHGDAVANDGIFTLYRPNDCTASATAGMDGSIVLFSAKDNENHLATTRMILHVIPGPTGGNNNGGGLGGSGRPPNLRWNGNQGYNIFNASQWDTYGYAASPTRTFKGADTVVVVVGSASLVNVYGVDQFTLLDPFSGNPAQSVVYGASKTVTSASIPSTTSSFSFYQFVNGYYIYSYRFKLNDAGSVGVNYYTPPPQYPRYYYFASYPLSVLLTDSQNDRFTTTDAINITADNGNLRAFPSIRTFSDPAFRNPSTVFSSTAIVYVQVNMLTVDANGSNEVGKVFFGNVQIKDFAGGQQLNRAPTGGIYANLPICPPKGSCGSSAIALWSDAGTVSYRFSINLARVNQDPWVAGLQNYGLTITSIKDSDESYAAVSSQLQIQAPLYKMDLAIGDDEGANPAWASHVYSVFYQDFNGFDAWKPLAFDVCSGGQSTSGVQGGGNGKCPTASNVELAYGDFWHDGTLGIAESFVSSSTPVVIYRRAVDATGAIVYLPVFYDPSPPSTCTAIAAGDLTGNGLPSVVCGGANGWIWYYANNGNWTRTYVDQPGSGSQINTISIGDFNGDVWNDIAVGGASGYLKWYPNLGYGRFQNTGISDNWFAGTEQTLKGNVTSGSYLSTYVQDGIYEQVTEGPLNFSLRSGSTVNPSFNNSAANWTFASAYNGATGAAQPAGGNPSGAYAQVTAPFHASSTVAGYWYQPFTVTGSSPFTASLSLNYEITTNTASNGVTMAAFVNATCNRPPASASSAAWTSGPITTARGWTVVSNVNVGSLITTKPMSNPATYCLEVVMYAAFGSGTVGSSVGGFDNVLLTWSSTAGSASALEQYWRFGVLPTRPGTAFTFNLIGHETGSTTPPEFDNFTIAYSTNVVGTDPTTGTYTTMFTVTGTSDVSYTFAMPASVAGKTVWIRALDTNRVVAASPSYDTIYVDKMWINANTPSGTTGVTLTADGSTINMVDAQSSLGNGFSDLVAGTSNGNVYKWMGSAGGLTASGLWYAAGTSVSGVKFGNFTTSFPGLAIGLSFGTTVRIIRGDVANTVIQSSLPAFSPSSTITAFAVGDINGDGWDDVAIGTSGGGVYLWENLGQGTSWTYAVTVTQAGSPVFSLILGDTTNSQYVGR